MRRFSKNALPYLLDYLMLVEKNYDYTKKQHRGGLKVMAEYSLGITPLLDYLQSIKRSVKHVAFADELTGARKLEEMKIWWEALTTKGPKFGYYPKSSKAFLIVNQHFKEHAERIFASSNIEIITEETAHLGVVLGDISFKEEYLQNVIQSCKIQLEIYEKLLKRRYHILQ